MAGAIDKALTSRRGFFSTIAVGWVAFTAFSGAWVAVLIRFFFPNVLFEAQQLFTAGVPEDFLDEGVSTKFKKEFGVWMVRSQGKIIALRAVCTHLGCTPNWLEAEQKYKCPCHGSGFYKDGTNFEGPAPTPLERYHVFMDDRGRIVVDKSKTYLRDRGEWQHQESFISV